MLKTLITESSKQAQWIDARRRYYILSFVSYITSSVMLFYGFKNLYYEQILLPVILFGTGLAFLLNIIIFHYRGNLNRACFIESLLVGSFVLGLVYQGGFNNTALYWVFPFPAILFGLTGVKNALIANSILLLLLSIMLFVPELILAEYKEAEASRFIASLVLVIVVCCINDLFRERSHDAMNQLQQSKEAQANTDPLTQLANRRFIESTLTKSLQQQPENFFPLAIIMCDLDHFKQVNDTFGHDAGDEVLKALAALFNRNTRRNDIACRSGGEEFLLFLPQTRLNDAVNVAEKIRQQLAGEIFMIEASRQTITASFGVAVCHEANEFNATIKAADLQLYQAKQHGRNKVCPFWT